jgi:uncharacterized protein YeaO (DUF488 family)
MGTIAVKRVYDPPAAGDGYRVLVDRLWPRGLTKAAAGLDAWAKDLAPSPDLRKEFNHRPERFAEFTHHYLSELSKNPAAATFRAELKRPKVTLLYGAHDREHNHALVLADFLKKARPKKAAARKAAKKAKRKKAEKKKIAKKPVAKKPRAQAAATRARSR